MRENVSGRPLTGRMVLFMLLAFFGVVIAVNLTMLRLASSTFSGQGDRNAYVAGLSHNKAIEAAREQDRRGWKIQANLERAAPGRSIVTVVRADAGAYAKVDVSVRFGHPASSRLDRSVVLAPAGANAWRGAVDLPAGAWDMVIEMRSAGAIVFLSRDRINAADDRAPGDG